MRRFIKKTAALVIICITGCTLNIEAQVVINQPHDINSMLADSSASAVVEPAFNLNTISRIFDGNPLTEAGVLNSDTVTITLSFNEPTGISKSKVFFWNGGKWSLETANSLSDLNNHTGSYAIHIDNKQYSYFNWDSAQFSQVQVKFIRLTAVNPTDSSIYLGEWMLEGNLTLTDLVIIPHPPILIPGAYLQSKVYVKDEYGKIYPFELNEPFIWKSSDTSVVLVDGGGKMYGKGLGSSVITVSTESNSIFGSAVVSVYPDFVSEKVESRIVKVALVLQDPVVNTTGTRLHTKYGWLNPNYLVEQLIKEFKNASDTTVIFQLTEVHDVQFIFTRLDSLYMTVQQLVGYFDEPGWVTIRNLAEVQGRIKFDYNAMIDYFDFCTKRDQGIIDEVWVYSFPFGGMYESRLAGQGAFWWNSPPLTNTSCIKLLSIMGWNYERGVAEAMESAGHRFESAFWKTFGRWDVHNPNPNAWEIYTRIDKELPGKAHIGNIHFPPNGMSDYDYNNTASVTTYADNWKRYPYLFQDTRIVNCVEWNCGHLQYMRWWFSHLPRYKGVTDSVLNNWWHYALDYYGAVELAKNTPIVSVEDENKETLPEEFSLLQNYPNPFNPSTVIEFSIPSVQKVELTVYDILGRKVKEIVNNELPSGRHKFMFKGSGLASGIYFYSLRTGQYSQVRKMVLIR